MASALRREDALALLGNILAERQRRQEEERRRYDWEARARPKQRLPGTPRAYSPRTDWRYLYLSGGRGSGKTLTGANTLRGLVRDGKVRYPALVAPTLNDGRRLMIEGPSGLLEQTPPNERPRWVARDRELHWPNGVVGTLYTTEEPERLRGGNHDFAWCEEMGSWRNADAAWSNLRLAVRLARPDGGRPFFVITTTPRPTPLIKAIVADPATEAVIMPTDENAENLDPDFMASLEQYRGTRLGRQELMGELLGDTPGALWKMALLDSLRVRQAPDLTRIVVAVDPAVADAAARKEAKAAERYTARTGIVSAGVGMCLCKGTPEQHGFVLRDSSGYYEPAEWARVVARDYAELHADRVVAEINNGGALVESNIRTLGDAAIAYRPVTASRGKSIRAEPIAALYEQGKVHHLEGLTALEDELTTWNPLLAANSPDRLDAVVWALTDLMLGPQMAVVPRGPIAAGHRRI